MLSLWFRRLRIFLFFFFNDTATTEIYTLSLHDALPISRSEPQPEFIGKRSLLEGGRRRDCDGISRSSAAASAHRRSEEHTSELQSPCNLVCRLLLEKKKTTKLHMAVHSRNDTRHDLTA